MKLINLLVDISKGKEPPKKIKFNGDIYEWCGGTYCNRNKSIMSIECYILSKWNLNVLNDKVEILDKVDGNE